MPLELSKRTQCRRRADFGITIITPKPPRVSPYAVLSFALKSPEHPLASYKCYLPVGTPDRRIRGVRDHILAKIDEGRIATPEQWRAFAARLARNVAALNREDGIRPPVPWSARKAATQSLLSSVSKSSV